MLGEYIILKNKKLEGVTLTGIGIFAVDSEYGAANLKTRGVYEVFCRHCRSQYRLLI